jgi:hypothetical protein
VRLDHLLSKESGRHAERKGSEVSGTREIMSHSILFDFEGPEKDTQELYSPQPSAKAWGYSSAGRAPALQAGGQGFDSLYLHHMGS